TLINQKNLTDILFKPAFNKLKLNEKKLKAYPDTLFELKYSLITPLNFISIHTTFKRKLKSKTLNINFIIVDVASTYNAL
ncbi:hypothetical protein C1T30_43630, partial [Bacillus sp. MBGLi97]